MPVAQPGAAAARGALPSLPRPPRATGWWRPDGARTRPPRIRPPCSPNASATAPYWPWARTFLAPVSPPRWQGRSPLAGRPGAGRQCLAHGRHPLQLPRCAPRRRAVLCFRLPELRPSSRRRCACRTTGPN